VVGCYCRQAKSTYRSRAIRAVAQRLLLTVCGRIKTSAMPIVQDQKIAEATRREILTEAGYRSADATCRTTLASALQTKTADQQRREPKSDPKPAPVHPWAGHKVESLKQRQNESNQYEDQRDAHCYIPFSTPLRWFQRP
jgi:hypothetical protein